MKRGLRIMSSVLLAAVAAGGSVASAQDWKGSVTWRAGKSDLGSALSPLASPEGLSGKIGRVRISTYSSPEGSLSWNTRLSDRRTETVVSYLKENIPGLSDGMIEIVNVPEDWSSVETYVRLSGKQWKDEALEILRSGKSDIENRLQDLWGGVVWDDLLWNCFTRIRRTEVTIDFESDTRFSGTSSAETVKPVVPLIRFAVGSTSLDESVLDNIFQLKDLGIFISGVPPDATIVLDSFSSPEGRPSWNKVLAKRRAETVRQRIVGMGVPADRIIVRSCEENWSGLREVASSLLSGDDLGSVMQVLDDGTIDDAEREIRLQSLDGGRLWRRLLSEGMSALRYVRVSVNE